MTASCPIYIGSPAVALVNEGWNFFQIMANDSYNIAKGLVVDISQFTIDPVNFNYTFDPPGNPAGFKAPVAPADPGLTYDSSGFHDPGDTPDTGLNDINFKSVPDYHGPTTVQQFARLPTATAPAKDYGDAPVVATSYALPTLDTLNLPELQPFLPLNLPSLPPMDFPVFSASAPIVDFAAPSGEITFNPTAYASTELDAIRAKLAEMLNGSIGLPTAVTAALFARARAREDMTAAKAIQEAFEEFASRGYSLPPGALAQRLAEVRQNNQNQVNSFSRDIYVQDQGEILKSMRQAVTDGIALEGKLMDTFMHLQDLQLQAQKYMVDANIAIFNALVSLFNARQQAYAVAAQVYRDRLQGELAKVEVYKAQIEGQRLIEEINKDRVAIYEAQLRGVNLLIEKYKAQLEAVRTQTEIDRNRVEIFRARVSAFAEEVRAYAVEWDAYKAQVEGDATRARIFETQVNAYATQVRAVADGNKNLIDQGNLRLEVQKTEMLGWRGKLDRLIADMDAESKRVQAGATIFDGKARIYSAAGQIAASEADSNTRAFSAVVEAGRASKEIDLENVKAKIQQVVQIGQIIAEQLKAAGQTAAQLAAGAMSAVHFAAQAQDSSSVHQSSDCQTSYQFSGSV